MSIRIRLDNGVSGDAYLLAFHYSPNAIAGALRDIHELAMGWEVSPTLRRQRLEVWAQSSLIR